MIEPDIKQKIINTISRYEKKCDKLEEDINCLKNALSELTSLPAGIYVDLDPHIDLLRLDLKNDAEPPAIQAHVNALIAVLSRWISSAQNKKAILDLSINDSLHQLINHLAIPDTFQTEVGVIKNTLEQQLENENLRLLIDNLTTLVVDAFNLKQNQFRTFVQQVSEQFRDFDQYLEMTVTSQMEASEESKNLETGIAFNLAQIKNHIVSARTLDELSTNLGQNMEGIGQHMRTFRENEGKRNHDLEQKMRVLQEKLSESEQASKEMRNQLSSQAFRVNHDGLTGLANRLSYDEHILEAFNRWKRGYGELCLAIADIDYFKKINDTYGHLAGDKVLKNIASVFKKAIRSMDFVGRYGGEEFVFIFEKTRKEDGVMVLEKLRKLAENCQFSYKNEKVNISLSFGITACLDSDDVESLFVRADEAMYKAKRTGRNRVVAL